ncbi:MULTISPECIES: formate dehydrogenase beta subunit [unclassified Chelatococcus]|uniref:formate dehydrogenase beta subunit n=1 Tax=unclassified Chelatococcus TaxID=2638111 RepID=UPI0020BFCD79|nr:MULTISPECIES: formate dehydrogenase beta subunit [unclassified Chelatococcus]
MTLRIFVPGDSGALAVGADEVAAAIAAEAGKQGLAVTLVRNGSRGLYWLEPLVEVETPAGRIAFGPVTPDEVQELVAGLASAPADPSPPGEGPPRSGGGGVGASPEEPHPSQSFARIPSPLEGRDRAAAPFTSHPLYLGPTEDISFLKRQTRFTFARCGVIDPLSLEDYRAAGGLKGLQAALALTPETIVDQVTQAGLRGRGGAGFPTGIKWKTVLAAEGPRKFVVTNADEGDSGTFADRMLMEGDPFVLIEGMIIAGLAVGASHGYIYSRSEYPHANRVMEKALAIAESAGLLGMDILASGRTFTIELRIGAGAYVCGEETALLESIEGKRGQVRAKPPLPAIKGLFGAPTVINNLLTLASVPFILAEGAAAYAAVGFGRSRGTMAVQLAGNIRHGGLFETGFGVSLGELVEDIGGGTATGRPVKAVQVGGPLGAYFPPSLFDTPFDYEAFAARDGLIGHGGIVVFDDTVEMAQQARFAMEFCAIESCGKCTPCRIGSTRGVEVVDRIIAGHDVEADAALLADLCDTMKFGSLCALGGFTPYPVMSALTHFPQDFGIVPPNGRMEAAE